MSLHDSGVQSFEELVYIELQTKITQAVISLIGNEREARKIDRALVKNVVEIPIEIGVGLGSMGHYVDDFEYAMLKDTKEYYSKNAMIWVVEDTTPEYMIKAEECLRREKERVGNYLHSSTEVKLLKQSEFELLEVYKTELLEKEGSGVFALLREEKTEDLARMFRLFNRVELGLEPVCEMFKKYVSEEGLEYVTQAEDAVINKKGERKDTMGSPENVFVKKVLDLHDKYLDYVDVCFQNHILFHRMLKEAFEVFCNKDIAGNPSAEVLSTFCDTLLKKGASDKSGDEGMDEVFDKVVKLLAYYSDKDLFAEFCRKKLARRLLFDRSASDEHERTLLTKLKQQCGGALTSKMEGMVTDLTLAKEKQAGFEDYIVSNPHAHPGIDLTVNVLTTGFWPSYKSSDLSLPEEMVKCVGSYKQYYESNNKKKKLNWISSLGSCNLNAKFTQKNIELIVSTYQAALLLLFNNTETLSYSEVKDQLNLADDDVLRLLHSLSCSKYKILVKEPNTKTVSPKDSFSFNLKFTDKMRRIRVPLPPMDEKKKIIEDVDKDRRFAIDASIVRIMKSRKVLAHQQLVTECVEQLSKMFKPDFRVIKKRIEDLISREYLERDESNPNTYHYLA